MKNFASSAWCSVVTWRLSILRCLLYGGIVAWGVFKAGTQGYDHWGDMSVFQRVWLFGDMFTAFGGVVLAFLDNSIQKLATSSVDTAQITTQTQTTVKTAP